MTEQLDLDLEFFEEVEEHDVNDGNAVAKSATEKLSQSNITEFKYVDLEDDVDANNRNENVQSSTKTPDRSKVAEFKYKSLHINVVSSNQIPTNNGNSYTMKDKPINLEKSKFTIYKLTPKNIPKTQFSFEADWENISRKSTWQKFCAFLGKGNNFSDQDFIEFLNQLQQYGVSEWVITKVVTKLRAAYYNIFNRKLEQDLPEAVKYIGEKFPSFEDKINSKPRIEVKVVSLPAGEIPKITLKDIWKHFCYIVKKSDNHTNSDIIAFFNILLMEKYYCRIMVCPISVFRTSEIWNY